MGDRAWAQLTLYQVGGPKEVEAICAFIDEHLGNDWGDTTSVKELEVWGDYNASEVSLGLCDEAEGLAESTPNSIWAVFQDGYSGPGETIYHLPGFGTYRCTSDDEPLYGRAEVLQLLAMKPGEERDRKLGIPWVETCAGMAKWLNALPEDKRPRFPRPTPDEVESWEDDDTPKTKRAEDVTGADRIRPIGDTGPLLRYGRVHKRPERRMLTFYFQDRSPWEIGFDEEVEYV